MVSAPLISIVTSPIYAMPISEISDSTVTLAVVKIETDTLLVKFVSQGMAVRTGRPK